MRADSSVPSPHHSPNDKWWAMLGIGLGVLMFTIDTSIVNIALPTLVNELHTTFATIQWVVLSYLLIVTALVLGAARLGDMLGKKRLYNIGLASSPEAPRHSCTQLGVGMDRRSIDGVQYP